MPADDRTAQAIPPPQVPARAARLVIAAEPMAVRQALCALFEGLLSGPMPADMPPDARDTAQIVLAEVLNNIVEHAYDQARGEIEVTLELGHTGLCCRIIDGGRPMPGGALPEGRLPSLPAAQDDPDLLPEGGYGWHLIRSLSQDLDYRREGGRNLLTFRIEVKQ